MFGPWTRSCPATVPVPQRLTPSRQTPVAPRTRDNAHYGRITYGNARADRSRFSNHSSTGNPDCTLARIFHVAPQSTISLPSVYHRSTTQSTIQEKLKIPLVLAEKTCSETACYWLTNKSNTYLFNGTQSLTQTAFALSPPTKLQW